MRLRSDQYLRLNAERNLGGPYASSNHYRGINTII